MDTITIKNLEALYCVGVPEQERVHPQRLLISLELRRDFSSAVLSDDLGATIDYYKVVQRLLCFGEGRSWKLIEKLSEDIATMVMAEFKPDSLRVEVKKFVIPEAQYVAVSLERTRQPKSDEPDSSN